MRMALPDPRSFLQRWAPTGLTSLLRSAVEHVTFPPDMSEADISLHMQMSPYTMTSPERVVALRDALAYVLDRGLAGDIVECGVWRGGSMMVVAQLLQQRSERRRLHLFDTFEGMSEPTDVDVSRYGRAARDVLKGEQRKQGRTMWCIASEQDVRANIESTGYPLDDVTFVKGKVEETLPARAPAQIVLLRLDTDWYESTRHELECLYPRVVSGGVIIIDDYGYWQGARRAVDEFLARLQPRPLLSRIDNTGRLMIKP